MRAAYSAESFEFGLPAKYSFAPFQEPIRTGFVVIVAPPDSAAEATSEPFTYSRWVVPSYVPTTWYVTPAAIAPAGAWSRRRAPDCITVNSSRGPLNWSDQLSCLVSTDRKLPAAGYQRVLRTRCLFLPLPTVTQ